MPLTRLGLPLGYGFPGIIPQEEIIATGALQPSLHTYMSGIVLELLGCSSERKVYVMCCNYLPALVSSAHAFSQLNVYETDPLWADSFEHLKCSCIQTQM